MPDDYMKTMEHSYAMEAQTGESPARSRLGYLAQHIFDFTTYESEADELFARKAVEVCAAITDGKTSEYIANPTGRIWYLLMVNMPFFMPRLGWGTSIRGAWWDHEQPVLDSCGLWAGGGAADGVDILRRAVGRVHARRDRFCRAGDAGGFIGRWGGPGRTLNGESHYEHHTRTDRPRHA